MPRLLLTLVSSTQRARAAHLNGHAVDVAELVDLRSGSTRHPRELGVRAEKVLVRYARQSDALVADAHSLLGLNRLVLPLQTHERRISVLQSRIPVCPVEISVCAVSFRMRERRVSVLQSSLPVCPVVMSAIGLQGAR